MVRILQAQRPPASPVVEVCGLVVRSFASFTIVVGLWALVDVDGLCFARHSILALLGAAFCGPCSFCYSLRLSCSQAEAEKEEKIEEEVPEVRSVVVSRVVAPALHGPAPFTTRLGVLPHRLVDCADPLAGATCGFWLRAGRRGR